MFLSLMFLIVFSSLVSAITIREVDISPKEIEPGKSAEIQIILENNLDTDVSDVSVSLNFNLPGGDLPFAPYGSSSEVTLSEIREDKTKTINFKIVALNEAESGIYKIPVSIGYKDDDGVSYKKDSLISLTINSPPLLDVKSGSGLILKGQKNKITVNIVNKGLSKVKFLEIEVKGSTLYDLISENKIYIGNIESDDFDSADFEIFFRENSPTKIELPVSLTYKDSANKEYSEDFKIDLKVYDKETALSLGLIQKNNTITYIILIVVLIVIYLVYRRIRKARKRKKAEKSD